jgi:hypothetical protein
MVDGINFDVPIRMVQRGGGVKGAFPVLHIAIHIMIGEYSIASMDPAMVMQLTTTAGRTRTRGFPIEILLICKLRNLLVELLHITFMRFALVEGNVRKCQGLCFTVGRCRHVIAYSGFGKNNHALYPAAIGKRKFLYHEYSGRPTEPPLIPESLIVVNYIDQLAFHDGHCFVHPIDSYACHFNN